MLEDNCVATVEALATCEFGDLAFPDKFAAGKKGCLREAVRLAKLEEGEVSGAHGAAEAAAAASAVQGAVVASNQQLVDAFKEAFPSKKKEVVHVELETQLKGVRHSLATLFPEGVRPANCAVRPTLPCWTCQ